MIGCRASYELCSNYLFLHRYLKTFNINRGSQIEASLFKSGFWGTCFNGNRSLVLAGFTASNERLDSDTPIRLLLMSKAFAFCSELLC